MRLFLLSAAVLGLGTYAFASTYTEAGAIVAGANQTPPVPYQEYNGNVFGSTLYDGAGRVISAAAVPQSTGPTDLTLDGINSKLFRFSDVDLFKIQIVTPTAFTANTFNNTSFLTLFAADGTAVAAATGTFLDTGTGFTTTYGLSGATLGLTAGTYYLGVGNVSTGPFAALVPKNAAGQALFDLGSAGVKTPLAVSDLKLSTDPTAWGQTTLLASNQVVPTVNVSLTGVTFAVPEPTLMSLLGVTGAGLLRRRRI